MSIPLDTDVVPRLLARLSRFGGNLDPDVPLQDLGLDSMDIVELLCAIHEEFHVRLTEQEYQPEKTLRELAEIITSKLQA